MHYLNILFWSFCPSFLTLFNPKHKPKSLSKLCPLIDDSGVLGIHEVGVGAGDMSQTSLRIGWKFTARMGTPRWACCFSQEMGNHFQVLAWVIRINCKLSPGWCQSGHGYFWPLKRGLRLTGDSRSSLWTSVSQDEDGNDEILPPGSNVLMCWPSAWKSVLACVHDSGKCDLSFQVTLLRLLPLLWLVVWFTLRLLYLNSNVVI